MTTTQILILTSIIVYLIATIAIGVWSSRKNETTEDFYLGGRKLGPIITAMSAEASDMSSYLLMGVPGVAYVSGLADATWTIIGLAVADCGKTPPHLYGKSQQFHHGSGIYFQPLR